MTGRSAYGLDTRPIKQDHWGERAACLWGGRLKDPEAWFITSKKRYLSEEPNCEALYICQNECPVRVECWEAAVELRHTLPLTGEIRGGYWFDNAGVVHEFAGSAS